MSTFVDGKLTGLPTIEGFYTINHPSFGRPVSLSTTFTYGYPPHFEHLTEEKSPIRLLPVGHVKAIAPTFDTVVFNAGFHHVSTVRENVLEYRAAVNDLMDIAQKHPHGYMLESISQHFNENDGSYEGEGVQRRESDNDSNERSEKQETTEELVSRHCIRNYRSQAFTSLKGNSNEKRKL